MWNVGPEFWPGTELAEPGSPRGRCETSFWRRNFTGPGCRPCRFRRSVAQMTSTPGLGRARRPSSALHALQSTLMLAALATALHFAYSAAVGSANSCDDMIFAG